MPNRSASFAMHGRTAATARPPPYFARKIRLSTNRRTRFSRSHGSPPPETAPSAVCRTVPVSARDPLAGRFRATQSARVARANRTSFRPVLRCRASTNRTSPHSNRRARSTVRPMSARSADVRSSLRCHPPISGCRWRPATVRESASLAASQPGLSTRQCRLSRLRSASRGRWPSPVSASISLRHFWWRPERATRILRVAFVVMAHHPLARRAQTLDSQAIIRAESGKGPHQGVRGIRRTQCRR